MKIYIYKEFCDSEAYGEEIIKAFAEKEAALGHLRGRVETYYGVSWENIPDECGWEYDPHEGYSTDNTFKNNYVSISDGNCTRFWVVEEQDIIGETRPEWHLKNAISELKESATEDYEGELSDILGMTSEEWSIYGGMA